MREYLIRVEGMTCSSCENLVRSGLTQQYGEQLGDMQVNAALKFARIGVVSSLPTQEQLIHSINQLGFSAKPFNRDLKQKSMHFALKRLSGQAVLNNITNEFQTYPNVNKVNARLSTQTLSVSVSYKNEDELNHARAHFLERIRSISSGSVIPELIHGELFEQDEEKHSPKYIRQSLINFICASALSVAQYLGLILLPLTPAGQIMGISLGLISLIVMWMTGREYYADALKKLRQGQVNMNSLILLGTGSAWFLSMLMVFAPAMFPAAMLGYHFMAVNMILGIVNFGRHIRAKAQLQAKDRVQSLLDVFLGMQPQYACKLKRNYYDSFNNNETNPTHYREIKTGDLIEVLPGQRFPVDGEMISKQRSKVNQDIITGEASPILKSRGDSVYSGTENLDHTVYIRATKNGSEGTLARIIEEVSKASRGQTSTSNTVDKIAKYFVPGIIGLSMATGIGWAMMGGASMAWMIINAPLSVLLCACPCALALATPISMTLGVYEFLNLPKGSEILVREASKLELLADTQNMCVVFDKTGTLTEPKINEIHHFRARGATDLTDDAIRTMAASIEQFSTHPIAKALTKEINRAERLECRDVNQFDHGVVGTVKFDNVWRQVCMGTSRFVQSQNVNLTRSQRDAQKNIEAMGLTAVFLSVDGICRGVIGLKHDIREDAAQAMRDLKRLGLKSYMLTGDNESAALSVARKIGIQDKNVFARKNEEEKAAIIKKLKQQHKTVLYLGDGVNDLKATQEAHVGIAVGPLTQNSAAASISLKKLNLGALIVGAKAIARNIKQNLYWTGAYNLLSITLAMGLLYSFVGFALNPVFASLGMAFSSVYVVLNSTRVPSVFKSHMQQFNGTAEPISLWQRIKNMFNPALIIQSAKQLMGHQPFSDVSVKSLATPRAAKAIPAAKVVRLKPNPVPVRAKIKVEPVKRRCRATN
jgi:Cu+-exporting ATPase